MPMKQSITKELMNRVNAQGTPLTTMQWFTIDGYIGMGKWHVLEMLQHIKPKHIYDIMEQMQKELKEKKKW